MITKDIAPLVVKVKSLTQKYIKKLDSKEDIDRLSKILLAHEDWLERKLSTEKELKQTDIMLYYNRIIEDFVKRGKDTKNSKYARDEEILIADTNISYIENELIYIAEATTALEENPEQFKAVYNNGRPKDDSETPHPLDEIATSGRVDPFKIVLIS